MNNAKKKITLPWKPIKGGFQNLTGLKFGRLTVLGFCRQDKHRNKYWNCRCDCGKECTSQANSLRLGTTTSCGCYRLEAIKKSVTIHGLSKSPVYCVWASMHQRCKNPKSQRWSDYGGRGITVCERWNNVENFVSDMGPRPKGGSIERIDNSKGYSPENCKWASNQEQCVNKRVNKWITYNGETLTTSQWTKRIGLADNTILTRLNRGWSVERALTAGNQRLKKA